MRIAYFTEWSPYEESGVLRKILGQVAAWRALGHEAALFTLSPRRDGGTAPGFAGLGETIGAIRQSSLELYPFARLGFVNRLASVPRVARRLREYRPDILYYRAQGPWYPGLGAILRVAPAVVEINTLEGIEAPRWGRLHGLWQRLTGARTLRDAAAMVCVTDEIAAAYAHFGKPAAVIANSLDDIAERLPPSGNATPGFVFVGSATVGAGGWHGVDKIAGLARALPECRFDVVGLHAAELGIDPPANLRFHGPLHGAALAQVYRGSDVAISTLALHRMGMEEACPLKTREYLMLGLPVIAGYREAERALRGADHMLDIGNREDNVAASVDAIRAFAARWTNRRVEADLDCLTGRAKARERIAFFETLLGGGGSR